MKRFYLIRHGERASQSEDTLLSDEGKKQAEVTGKYLSTLGNISLIYASPLKRTQQTAEIFSRALKLPVITDARLLERMRWGDRIGESYDEFISEWHKTAIDRDYNPPMGMGDSSCNTGNRVKALVDEISENQEAVIVSHFGAIGDFLRNVFNDSQLPISSDHDGLEKFIDLKTCSITEVTKQQDKYFLQRVNDTKHLLSPVI